jgi:hypothetical protein
MKLTNKEYHNGALAIGLIFIPCFFIGAILGNTGLAIGSAIILSGSDITMAIRDYAESKGE